MISILFSDLGRNRFLCDCNMKWLPQWALKDTNEVSPQTRCYHPIQLRQTLVNGLAQDMNWNCGNYWLCSHWEFYFKNIRIC